MTISLDPDSPGTGPFYGPFWDAIPVGAPSQNQTVRYLLYFIPSKLTLAKCVANANAAISSANVVWKYSEIIPRQFYEAKRLFLSIHVAVLATYGWLVRF